MSDVRKITSSTITLQMTFSSRKRRRPVSCMCVTGVFSLAILSQSTGFVGAFDNGGVTNHATYQTRGNYRSRSYVRRNTINEPRHQTRISNAIGQGKIRRPPQDNSYDEILELSQTTAHNETISSFNQSRISDLKEQQNNRQEKSNNNTTHSETSGLSQMVHEEGNDEGNGGVGRTIRLVIGFGIIAIIGLSLFGWAYIFYQRYQFEKEIREQTEEENKTPGKTKNDSPCFDKSSFDQSRRSPTPITLRTASSGSENMNAFENLSRSFEDFYGCDGDSFDKELQIASKVDQHMYTDTEGAKASLEARNKPVPPLAPPARDVIKISHKKFDDSIPGSYDRQTHIDSSKVFPSFLPNFRLTKRSSSPILPDPDDVVLTSGSSTSSSYAGKSSSLEGDGSSGFEVIPYHNSSDEVDANLLNPVLLKDDESIGQHSGMEMSLGTDNDRVSPTGFFVIDDENDMRHEYISQEEYEAAVKAAACVLNNSLRRSPVPSDERMGLSQNPSDEIMQDIVKELDVTPYRDMATSLSSTSASSNLPPTTSVNGKTSLSSESTSNVLSELKDVSIFLKHYEKKKLKKSQKSQNKPMTEESNPTRESVRNEQPEKNSFSMSSDPSKLYHKPTETDRHRKPERHISEISSSVDVAELRSKHEDKSNPVPRKLPEGSLGPSTLSNKSKNQEELDRDNESQDMSSHESKPRKRDELQSKDHPLSSPVNSVMSNPSVDSSTSEGSFLESEVQSFFSQKEPSVSNLLSETSRSFPQQSLPSNTIYNSTSIDTKKTSIFNSVRGTFNRLGIVPFDSKEAGKLTRPSLKQNHPNIYVSKTNIQQPDKKQDINKTSNANQQSTTELRSNVQINTSDSGVEDLNVVPPSNISVIPRSRIRQRENEGKSSVLNTNAIKSHDNKYIDQIRPRNDNPKNPVTPVAFTSPQSSTRKIASLIESSLGVETDRTRLRNHQFKSKPNFSSRNELSSQRSQLKSSAHYNNKIKRANESGKTNHHERIKPLASESTKTAMQSGAQNLISMFESKKVPTIPRGHTIWNNRRSVKSPPTNTPPTNTPQKAKSLISIFESNRPASDATPIFPQSEHWQYGKMRGGQTS